MRRTRHYASFALVALFVSLMGLVSCSEEDDTVEEFPNWPTVNDAYFNSLSDSVKAIIDANPSQTEWKRIKCWSKQDSIVGTNTDYIIVHVLAEGTANETASPLYTDTVTVHYTGRYIPSTSYPSGYTFDRSFYEPFDEDVSVPSQIAINGVIDGWITALMHMHRGDHWMVYVPYQLGYGNPSTKTGIEDGSTLIFDIRLVDFWSPRASE